MAPDTGVIHERSSYALSPEERAALVPISRREFPRVQAMSIADRKAWAAQKVARRDAAKRARKARRKSRA